MNTGDLALDKAAENAAIERHAVDMAKAHFAKVWPVIREVGRPYDLECRNGSDVLHVEVKGTTSSGKKVPLTWNEVKHARKFEGLVTLFIQAGVTLERKADGRPVASGGKSLVWEPWVIDEGTLEPIAYEYTVPELTL
jgi:hypothetical protein